MIAVWIGMNVVQAEQAERNRQSQPASGPVCRGTSGHPVQRWEWPCAVVLLGHVLPVVASGLGRRAGREVHEEGDSQDVQPFHLQRVRAANQPSRTKPLQVLAGGVPI